MARRTRVRVARNGRVRKLGSSKRMTKGKHTHKHKWTVKVGYEQAYSLLLPVENSDQTVAYVTASCRCGASLNEYEIEDVLNKAEKEVSS